MKAFVHVAHVVLLLAIAACTGAGSSTQTTDDTSSVVVDSSAVEPATISVSESYKPIAKVVKGTQTYYVDVVAKGPVATVWLRKSASQTEADDVRAMRLAFSTIKAEDLPAKLSKVVCVVKDKTDVAEGVVGCGSVLTAVACVPASELTAGALLPMCEATWEYAVSEGWGACVGAVMDAIAGSAPIQDAQKQAVKTANGATTASITGWSRTGVLKMALDLECYAVDHGAIDEGYFKSQPQVVARPTPLTLGPLLSKPSAAPSAAAGASPSTTPPPATPASQSKPNNDPKEGHEVDAGGGRGGRDIGGDKPGGDKPGGDKPGGDKPGGDKPGGDKPGGDKPGEKIIRT
jgi:hypothetical protein